MRIALCQIGCVTDDIDANVSTILKGLNADSDVYIFPEMFLTGYLSKKKDPEALENGLDRLLAITKDEHLCIVVGGPEYTPEGVYDAAYIISDSIKTYRKIHLPNFPPFDEKERFVPGLSPLTFEFKGVKFGVCICYDIFFPELLKSCTMEGSTVNIVLSASPLTSKVAFERVFDARALENTSYLVFANHIGKYGDMEFFGGSRVMNPDGSQAIVSDVEGTTVFYYDPEAVEKARKNRPVIADTVSKIEWQ